MSAGTRPYSTWIENCDAAHDQPGEKNPIAPGDVAAAHYRALSWLQKVSSQLPDPNDMAIEGTRTPVKRAAKRWFDLDTPRVDPSTRGHWHHIVAAIDRIQSRAPQTTYVCREFNSAARAPRGLALRLDRPYFRRRLTSVNHRAALLVHEWSHMWGGHYITPLFESYCTRGRFWKLGPERRVRLPDAYMGFVHELVTGRTSMGILCWAP